MEDFTDEITKEIKGYNGTYTISNRGRVYNLDRHRYLTPAGNQTQGFKVSLYRCGVRTIRSLHSLVAEHFISEYMPGITIRHLDGDKSNNYESNLMCVSPHNRANNKNYTEADVRWARPVQAVELELQFGSVMVAASFFDTDSSNIYKVLRGERKTHLGLTFEYID